MTCTTVSVYMPENSCRPKRGKGGFSFTRHPSERSDMYTKTGTTAFMDQILTLKKRKITGEFAHPPYFQGASAPHRIHWTAGKLPFRLPSERSAKRRSCGMQFPRRTRTAKPQARAGRAARLRCAAPYALRRQDINYTAKPQARAERATRLRCVDPNKPQNNSILKFSIIML